jgi:hypothetical protein
MSNRGRTFYEIWRMVKYALRKEQGLFVYLEFIAQDSGRVVSGCRRVVNEIFALLECYAA